MVDRKGSRRIVTSRQHYPPITNEQRRANLCNAVRNVRSNPNLTEAEQEARIERLTSAHLGIDFPLEKEIFNAGCLK